MSKTFDLAVNSFLILVFVFFLFLASTPWSPKDESYHFREIRLCYYRNNTGECGRPSKTTLWNTLRGERNFASIHTSLQVAHIYHVFDFPQPSRDTMWNTIWKVCFTIAASVSLEWRSISQSEAASPFLQLTLCMLMRTLSFLSNQSCNHTLPLAIIQHSVQTHTQTNFL